MSEYGFSPVGVKEAILGDSIEVCADSDRHFVVANSPSLKAEIYAPEINFYINSTNDEMLQIARNVEILYEAKAVMFDYGADNAYQKPVGKNIIFVSDNERKSSVNALKNAGFKVICLRHAEVKFVYGGIGDLSVSVLNCTDEYEVEADFFLVENAKSYQLRQSGCYEIAGLNDDEILALVSEKSPIYTYKNNISFNANLCQYEGRREELCAKCVEVCPSVALLKDEQNRKLEISHIDCIACGRCVSICPTGAISSAKQPPIAISQMAKLYAGKIPLLAHEASFGEISGVSLPCDVLPFGIFAKFQLDEIFLLSIMQETGSQIVLFEGEICEATKDAISLINSATMAIYGVQGVFVASNEAQLKTALNLAKSGQKWKFSLNETNLSKIEIFSSRMAFMVGEGDYGVIANGSSQSHAKISINEQTCTLCLSCAGACNTGALFADKSDNSLKFNASLCVGCDYCVLSCAEKDTMALDLCGVELKKEFFEYQILARDELFECIECGKKFATKKAIMKIANLMSAHFADDADKAKTLFCCADCKAKIMILKQMQEEI
ncbi:4Fe-4S binding protein [Campylobacter sp. VBCF_05 NA6]|uniref:4Fe-4S binding protein n=1 Tax=unclassified Campylobacter TaxID=2593542 RepID=UPI0022E9D9B2|nr:MULTISPECIES: 4Fe-4S binding protein [unclassified Campylobacter]MDA3057386.1 4Fe-4S binding protein [Campylobacter sp. VBCF_04 NA7]MDA3059042.1 4Fe-4S binding protein [Campylobacter sp. VBCF_05 NA6]